MSKVLVETIDKNLVSNQDSVKNRCVTTTIKFIQIIAIVLSISGLAYYIQQAYIKCQISPDISTTVKLFPSREIPLPAITICYPHYPTDLKLSRNPIDYLHGVSNQQFESNLTANQQNLMAFVVQTCAPKQNYNTLKMMCANRSETDFFKVLSSANYSYYFDRCAFCFRFTRDECFRILTKSVTDLGFCDTFNMQGFNAIFNDDVLSSDFDFYKNSTLGRYPKWTNPKFEQPVQFNDTINWTLEEGYNTSEDEILPVRALKRNSLDVQMATRGESSLCKFNGYGFLMFFHLPSEIPSKFSTTFFIPYKHDNKLKIDAKIYTNSPNMKSYSPKTRRCYYEGEKKLKFFKSYTKNLCDFECLTNYTLKQCGCVKFSMPREQNTKVCDIAELQCLNEALDEWPDVNDKEALIDGSATCDCLESCTSIQYTITSERAYAFNTDNHLTLLFISFDKHSIEEHTAYIAYTLQNLVADCGGLVGLFLGFSLLSIVELICNLVVFCVKLKQKNRTINIINVHN